MALINIGGLSKADKDQLNRIERGLIQMAIDLQGVKTALDGVKDAMTSGFALVEKEVIETAQAVKDLRDKIQTGGLSEAQIQEELTALASGLTTASATIAGKATEIAAALDTIQNPPAQLPELEPVEEEPPPVLTPDE
jgi:uncharacterized phage infection (PIP) family protein YhgE